MISTEIHETPTVSFIDHVLDVDQFYEFQNKRQEYDRFQRIMSQPESK